MEMPREDQAGTRTVRWLVSGRVQGVGFRYFVLLAARQVGLDGDVRNLRDGRVEVRVRGAAEELRRLLEEVRRGPSGSRVDRVEQEEIDVLPFEGFDVRF
jgi:acylphosphatase